MQENNPREHIRVAVRFRPLNNREKKEEANTDFKLVISPQKNSIDICKETNDTNHQFVFDHVFDEHISQADFFDKIAKSAVEWVAEGYNATIFAYGSTSSGKTYTMFGHEKGDRNLRGIIPRSCDYLFQLINESDDIVEANVKCSFLEIYRENIRDLLKKDNSDYTHSLRIRQNVKKGVYVQGALEKYVNTAEEILETIKDGSFNRSVASTALNNVSSRSHAVLTLTISQHLEDGSEIVSKLHLIDLAGSENVGKSEAQGTTLLEAQMINKSLSSLGNVIYALTEKGRDHIPYRDSRLTYLLQDSLGGNSKTILISTASPHSLVYSETLNTLKFAQRVKEIKNAPKVNRNESNANLIKTVAMLTKKLAELQSQLDDAQAIVEKVEKADNSSFVTSSSLVILLKTKCERLEKQIQNMQDLRKMDDERHLQSRAIFDKQRELAQSVAMELYKEKIKSCALNSELEQYKMFYDSLQDALETPRILETVVRNAKIRKSSLSVDTGTGGVLDGVLGVEIDSPVEIEE